MAKFLERRRIIIIALLISVTVLIAWQTHGISAIRVRIHDFKDKVAAAAAAKEEEKKKQEEEEKKKHVPRPAYLEIEGSSAPDQQEKLAYVTFLSGTVDQDDDLENDNYFSAVRILVWQLLHVPETRTKHDVVVMVTPTVSKSRRDRLQKDGAIIYPVEFLHTENDEWVKPERQRWEDVMTKMRVWEMTQYNRILMLDGDSMLRSSLDGVFDDPGAQILQTKDYKKMDYKVLPGEAPLPETYLLASLSEVWDSTHDFPPKEGTGIKQVGYMNAGFFIMAPSIPAYNYYVSLLNIPGSFDPRYPEQNLMNRAHDWAGPMPWREVEYTWNIRCPTENDFEQGLVSMHEKWWTQPYLYKNQKVKDWLLTRRYEMKGWYDARDMMLEKS